MVVQRVIDEVNLKLHEVRMNRHVRQMKALNRYAKGAQPEFEPNPRSVEKAIRKSEFIKTEMSEWKEGWGNWKNPWRCEVPKSRITRFLAKVKAAQKKNDALLAALKRHQK